MLETGIFFISLFIVFFIGFYLYNKNKLKTNKKDIGEISYLVGRFKLDRRKINYKIIIIWFAIINAFIISFVCTVIDILPIKLIWKMLIGFIALFIFIFLIYEIVGRICIRKGWKK